VEYELDDAEKMEIDLLADAGVPAPYIADEMEISLFIVEAYLDDLYGEEPHHDSPGPLP
jgi:hypothetical protein